MAKKGELEEQGFTNPAPTGETPTDDEVTDTPATAPSMDEEEEVEGEETTEGSVTACRFCDAPLAEEATRFERGGVDFVECTECGSYTALNPRSFSGENSEVKPNQTEKLVAAKYLSKAFPDGLDEEAGVYFLWHSLPYLRHPERIEGLTEKVVFVEQLVTAGQAWNQLSRRKDIVVELGYKGIPSAQGLVILMKRYGYKLLTKPNPHSFIFIREK